MKERASHVITQSLTLKLAGQHGFFFLRRVDPLAISIWPPFPLTKTSRSVSLSHCLQMLLVGLNGFYWPVEKGYKIYLWDIWVKVPRGLALCPGCSSLVRITTCWRSRFSH